MSLAEPPAPIRHAPIALWRIAQTFLATLHALFGAPEDVARRGALTREAHGVLASWLRVGEALLRKLLLIEAAAYPKPAKPPRSRPSRVRTRQTYTFTHDAPEKWRVCFRCFPAPAPASTSASPAASRSKAPAQRCRSAWPLAERYEAILRAFNDPVAAARRLAARLFARPREGARLLSEPPDACHRIDRHEELQAAAHEAARVFNSG